jgi:hypothetical protein
MKILLGIEGVIGKGIAATGAVRTAHQLGHQVDIITAWPQIWQGNPYVNKVWEWSKAEYLSSKVKYYDKIIFDDPYRQTKFLKGELNLAGTWNWMLNEIAESTIPAVYLNKAEDLYVKELLKDIKKPIMVVQTNGGTSEGYSWTRDIPLEEAVEMLNPFAEEYEIIHLRSNGQLELTGIKHTAELNIRQAMVILRMSEKRLLIDSVYQHAAAAFELPSVVLWAMTEAEKFGYKLHTNIECNKPMLKNMDRLEMLFSGLDANVDKCPFAPMQKIFDADKVIEALKDKK